jgi:hypothetical protein
MRAAVEQREEPAIDMEHDDVASLDVDHLVAAFWNLSGAATIRRVCVPKTLSELMT